MFQPVKKRGATPLMVQRLWASVDHVRQQKQIPNRDRIIRYITRAHTVSAEDAETELIRAVKDGLLMAYTAVGNKGSKVGKEQEGYKNPEMDPEWGKGSSDWYCFGCHKPGEIIQCSDCWRVYHEACMGDTDGDSTFTCAYCKTSKRQGRMKRKELNKLLSFVIIRLKEKAKELHRLLHREGEELLDRLVYRHMDLNIMEAKTEDRKYKYLDQFQADAHNIMHNIIICYGEHSGMAELARIMIRDCKYDLDEIRKCKDCYYYSNAKPADWFCKPCRPPHELVYAKQKGYSYWPAKVIKAEGDGYDVRFFGGRHERAVIPEGQLKSVNLSQKELDLKKTSGFMRALAELHQHQALLKEMEGRLSSEAASEPEQSPEDGEVEEEEEEEDEKPPPKKRRKVERERKKRKRSRVKEEEDGEEEEGEISSSNTMPDESGGKQQVRSPEDTHMVSSSVDNANLPKPTPTLSVATQTCKKLHNMGKLPSRATQTDGEIASKGCNCEEKYSEVFKSFKTRLAEDHERDKKKALQELTDRLHKDFEEDKQQAVSRAMNKMSQELERVQRQTEEQCKQQYMDEMKALAQKHKDHISAVKKKQWCFNCEEEAMYHCCWNTSYCSIKCQQEHWHKEHKRVCRRKR